MAEENEADETHGVAIGASMMNVTEDVTKMDITMDTSTAGDDDVDEPMSTTSNKEVGPKLSSIVKDQTALVISSDDEEIDETAKTAHDEMSLVCLGDKEETVLSGFDDDTDEFDMGDDEVEGETVTPVSVSEETATTEETKVSPARSVSPPPRLPTPKFTKVTKKRQFRRVTF